MSSSGVIITINFNFTAWPHSSVLSCIKFNRLTSCFITLSLCVLRSCPAITFLINCFWRVSTPARRDFLATVNFHNEIMRKMTRAWHLGQWVTRVRELWTFANLRWDLNHEIMNDTDFHLLLIVLLLLKKKRICSDWWIAQIGKNSEYFLKSSPLARYERRTNNLISAADNVKSCDWPRDAVT